MYLLYGHIEISVYRHEITKAFYYHRIISQNNKLKVFG